MTGFSLPGIAMAAAPAGPRPVCWDGHAQRLLAGATPGHALTAREHLTRWGPVDAMDLTVLAGRADQFGLRGAGGAAFPVARKLLSMRSRSVGSVIINGAEGETCSGKDHVLLQHIPHLVLDGAALVAAATRCRNIVIRLRETVPELARHLQAAIEERTGLGIGGKRIRFSVSEGPDRFLSGEANAVVNGIFTGAALPSRLGVPPRQPRGGRKYAYVSNVETYARLALAARGLHPGSALVTLSGATLPRVTERSEQTRFAQLLPRIRPDDIVITGGWHGAWVRAGALLDTRLSADAVARAGGRWGAGAFVVIPSEQARDALSAVAAFHAREGAGQCGPCRFGLPALAAAAAAGDLSQARVLAAEIGDRGACGHPGAATHAVISALECVVPRTSLDSGAAA